MKKLLSVFLAALMLFSVLGVSASAASYVTSSSDANAIMDGMTAGSAEQHVVIHYNTGVFALSQPMPVYDYEKSTFVSVNGLTGSYYQIPQNETELYVGASLYLPMAQSTDTSHFNGWYCQKTNQYFVAGRTIEIKAEMIDPYTECIELTADSVPAVAEEDTMGKIIDILCKIFGAIIGLLFYNGSTEAGVQLMEGILGGIMG